MAKWHPYSREGTQSRSTSSRGATNAHETKDAAGALAAKVKTRFLIISDTHDIDLKKYTASTGVEGCKRLPRTDVVLHCGDLTESGGLDNYKRSIEGLASFQDAELKLVIAGNHDADLDPEFCEKYGGHADALTDDSPEAASNNNKVFDDSPLHERALALWKAKMAREAGIVFLEEGTHEFTLKTGATFKVYASPYTPAYGISAFQYPTGHDRYNSSGTPAWATNMPTQQTVIHDGTDIVLTHGPPKYVLDGCADGSSGGCEHLARAICRTKPRLHCFGHIHRAWGARRAAWNDQSVQDEIDLLPEDFVGRNLSKKRGYASLSPSIYEGLKLGQETLFVNAAVGNDGEGSMENVPWVVDLELETSG
ncbi:hypothetical protein PMZ80_001077 [Knufia obscura]|uniref:Calcineurin-like phosphoesterase domain-containing protein n=1 Tax=Knufia obscura TaxID=1635080 RepID=A0ABR0S227_9EURO|nr:hypothetical protein PMZ80_001077 [Knufia obscura]